jgi:U3 small nucleolar RNA-associated protein MPP10
MSDIDDDGDDEDFETDYRYKDFFEESAPKKKNGKKVRFQEDDAEDKEVDVDQDMEEYEDEDDEEEAEENGTAPVLLGSEKEVSKPSSSHEMSREKMLKLIDKIQSENLNPRSWELSGEVKADDREVNSLLQKYVEADFRKKQPPINSKEKSDKIYSICLRRFKDKLFDDVTRKYRDDDTVQAYRNLTVDMNERKSLMDVYEDKYQAAQNGESGSTEDIDPQVKDIQKNMNELFYKLDALSHLQFAPSRISEEIRMVKNMPSMRVEEVGPMAAAAADETLLAPEEISRHVKKAPKSKDERTETDKNQERRKKKRKQSDMAKSGKMPKVGKDKEEAAPSTSKSSKKGKGKDFFAELQNVASREIKEKKQKADGSSKKKKKPKDKSETAAKYKA